MSKIKNVSDFFLGLVTISLSIALFFYSDRYAEIFNVGLGPSFTPKLVAVLAMLCGISIFLHSFGKPKTKKKSKNNNMLKAVIIMAVTFLYIYVLGKINYLAITAIYILVLMTLLYPKKLTPAGLGKLVLVALLSGVIFSVVFQEIFTIPV